MEKERKKFKDTKIGKFLKDKAPKILETVGDVLPDKGALGVLKNLISKDDTLTPEEREHALKLIEFEIQEIQEITKRWTVDTTSDGWLPKNIRPLVLAFLMVFMSFVIITDSQTTFNFDVKEGYIRLLESLLITVVVAYFGSRGVEKWQKIKKN
jgi:hypothetical protein